MVSSVGRSASLMFYIKINVSNFLHQEYKKIGIFFLIGRSLSLVVSSRFFTKVSVCIDINLISKRYENPQRFIIFLTLIIKRS